MTEKIFLSYAYQDRAIAEQVENHLREHGVVTTPDVKIFDPQKGIQVGDNIREVIKSQITAASKVVIITSPNSAQSQWVNYEAGMASALGKPIIVIGSRSVGKSAFLQALGDVRAIEIDPDAPQLDQGLESPARSVAEAAKISRTIDYLLIFALFFIFLGGYHIHFMLTAGDWDFWVDWKDRRLWVTVTPIMAITFCAAVQYMLWEKFRLPVGATLVILGLLFGEWVNRFFNFWGLTFFPINMVWPTSLVPSAIALDVILLLTRSYLLTALIGGLTFSLLMYPTNWPHLAPFHVPVEYHGSVMSVADVIGYQYVRTNTPEYIRMVEKGTAQTFGSGKDVAPVLAFFSGFVCIFVYFWWHFVGRWFATTRMLQYS